MDTRTFQQGDLVRRIFEDGWNRGSFEFLVDATAASMPFHYNGRTITVTPESLPPVVDEWRRAFPDLAMTIRHLIANDDLVAVALTLRGTQRGEWRGSEATGKRVAVEDDVLPLPRWAARRNVGAR